MDNRLSKINLENLYWLGRYVERVIITLDQIVDTFDEMLDKNPMAYQVFCEKIGITDTFKDGDHFLSEYILNEALPYSMISNINMAYQNAMVSRDILKIRCFGYLRNALSVLKKCDVTKIYTLKEVKDSLFAFWGSLQEYLESQSVYSIILMGKYVEKIDLGLRFQRGDMYRSWARLEWMMSHFEISLKYEEITLQGINSLFDRSFGES